MIHFNDAVAELLGSLTQDVNVSQEPEVTAEYCAERDFEAFKLFTIAYVKEHDKLEENHQILGQINNLNSVDEIEQILRSNLDYCDDCMLKLFRKYASSGFQEDENMCGCDGE